MFDRRRDRARRAGRGLFRPKVRVHLLELSHLSVCSPAQVAVASLPQVQMCDVLESTGGVEPRGELVGKRLNVNKAVCPGRVDGLLVQLFGIKLAAFDAGDLGADQCGAVCEVLRAVLRPDL